MSRTKPEKTLNKKKVSPSSNGDALDKLNQTLQKWFYQPDLQATRIVMGTIKSHYLNIGDPAWLYVVAPPGTGKTTTSIMSTRNLPEVVTLGDLSENTFLSGFYQHKQPGVLEKLGQTTKNGNTHTTQGNAIFLLKDFTTVLSMRREKRKAILSQLREIHDGEFKRSFGTGETKIWRGRVCIIAAVTPALDRHYSVFSTLGERFLQVRWHRPNSPEAGEQAIDQQGQEEEIREQLQQAVGEIFKQSSEKPPELGKRMTRRLARFAEVISVARTHVYREGFGNRDIEYIPEPEANTRIAKALAAIARGIAALKRRKTVAEEDLQDALRVGLDCLPEVRRKIFLAAIAGQDLKSVQMPGTTTDRTYEDLKELGILGDSKNPLKPTREIQSLLRTAKLERGSIPQSVRGG
ncbi:hypothetical protein MYX82_06925 [Acidobacteria bacterium AH-259-D05]|nr:hypothetical protein [Acidobacteria bacterium AH-259-D05]